MDGTTTPTTPTPAPPAPAAPAKRPAWPWLLAIGVAGLAGLLIGFGVGSSSVEPEVIETIDLERQLDLDDQAAQLNDRAADLDARERELDERDSGEAAVEESLRDVGAAACGAEDSAGFVSVVTLTTASMAEEIGWSRQRVATQILDGAEQECADTFGIEIDTLRTYDW